MNCLPANQKRRPIGRAWKRYEKPQPGHRLQLDVKFLERIAGTGKRASMNRSFISSWTKTALLTIYTCSTTSFVSGKTITITIDRMDLSTGRPYERLLAKTTASVSPAS
jgi:hypothetical protein